MADEIDRAQESEELHRGLALAAARAPACAPEAAEDRACCDCGEPISAERLRLVFWATRCLDCQIEFEEQTRGRA